MSAYTAVKTKIKDQECLVQALCEMGYDPEIHEEPRQLLGYKGDKRKEKAHVVIPRKQVGYLSNEVGFFRNEDGSFTTIVSEYDSGGHFSPAKQEELMFQYNLKTSEKKAKSLGLRVVSRDIKITNGKKHARLVTRQIPG